jgi:hypothetical protein
MFLYMCRAPQRSSSGGHCIYAVSGFLTLCMLSYVAQTKSGQSPLLVCATYGSIQSALSLCHVWQHTEREKTRYCMYTLSSWGWALWRSKHVEEHDWYYCWIKKIVHQVGCKISILIRCTNYPNLFCHKTLHVSGIFFAHIQEFATVYSALVRNFMQVFHDRFQAESGWSFKKLHETYQCRIYSSELLTMGKEDARNVQNFITK